MVFLFQGKFVIRCIESGSVYHVYEYEFVLVFASWLLSIIASFVTYRLVVRLTMKLWCFAAQKALAVLQFKTLSIVGFC
jgi:hypothetical protein